MSPHGASQVGIACSSVTALPSMILNADSVSRGMQSAAGQQPKINIRRRHAVQPGRHRRGAQAAACSSCLQQFHTFSWRPSILTFLRMCACCLRPRTRTGLTSSPSCPATTRTSAGGSTSNRWQPWAEQSQAPPPTRFLTRRPLQCMP